MEGFQFILCDGGLHIQFHNHRLILNENPKNFNKSSLIWYSNHNDYNLYANPECTVFNFKMSHSNKGCFYLEMPYQKYKAQLYLSAANEESLFSNLSVKA